MLLMFRIIDRFSGELESDSAGSLKDCQKTLSQWTQDGDNISITTAPPCYAEGSRILQIIASDGEAVDVFAVYSPNLTKGPFNGL